MANTKIFIMTHKKFNPPEKEGYIPLHVGRELGQDLGYLADNTGDHISDLNPYYGELTGLYWLWKNYPDVENIGICHYRRYFTNEKKQIMETAEFEKILQEYDVILPMVEHDKPYKEVFAESHNINDLLAVGTAIKKLYPAYVQAFDDMMDGKKASYGNLCVTKKEIFDGYCEWLFTVFAEVGDHVDLSSYDSYHKRLYGFLSESMFPVYAETNGLRIFENKASLVAEKAEVVELKQAMSVLVREERLEEARDMFLKFTEERPDVFLSQSDLKREVPLIEVLLAILLQEQKTGEENSLYNYSHDMYDLLKYLKAMHKSMMNIDNNGEIANETAEILKKHRPSNILNIVMEQYHKAYLEAYGNT